MKTGLYLLNCAGELPRLVPGSFYLSENLFRFIADYPLGYQFFN